MSKTGNLIAGNLIAGNIFILIGSLMIFSNTRSNLRILAQYKWPIAEATVKQFQSGQIETITKSNTYTDNTKKNGFQFASGITKTRNIYSYSVIYLYFIKEMSELTGMQFFRSTFESYSRAKNLLYKKGTKISIRYNPLNPKQSVITPRARTFRLYIVGTFFILTGIGVIFAKPRADNEKKE